MIQSNIDTICRDRESICSRECPATMNVVNSLSHFLPPFPSVAFPVHSRFGRWVEIPEVVGGHND